MSGINFKNFILYAMSKKASDIHLSSGNEPSIRVHGEVKKASAEIVKKEDIENILSEIMSETQKASFIKTKDYDFAKQIAGYRFRINAFYNLNGPGLALRAIPVHIPTLEEIHAPSILMKFADTLNGIVLITGPTGSGKSTTIAALINYINTNKKMHIITIEDPVEFVHKSKNCIINQREVFLSTDSFTAALKGALREDPDVLLVGEMRDLETIRLALTAAETGHLVFATLHTNSAMKTIDRIISIFPSDEQNVVRTLLSTSLKAVVSQRLMVNKNKDGVIAAHEILVNNPGIANLIRDGDIYKIQSMIEIGKQDGMQTMKESVKSLLDRDFISEEECNKIAGEIGKDKK